MAWLEDGSDVSQKYFQGTDLFLFDLIQKEGKRSGTFHRHVPADSVPPWVFGTGQAGKLVMIGDVGSLLFKRHRMEPAGWRITHVPRRSRSAF
jgi:hypothetical protein